MRGIFDVNVKLGQWPFRPVKGIKDLLTDMDRLHITRAAVSSLSAVHYFNPHLGNRELFTAIREYPDRFIPLACIRPNLSGWEQDFSSAIQDLNCKGIILYPNYHHFSLLAENTHTLVRLVGSHKVPVFIQMGLEDTRRQFDRPPIADVPVDTVSSLVDQHPQTTFVILGAKCGQIEQLPSPLPSNLFFDISNYEKSGEIEYAVDQLGCDRILFGTNFPLFNMMANILKLQRADIASSVRERIAHENAEKLFSLTQKTEEQQRSQATGL